MNKLIIASVIFVLAIVVFVNVLDAQLPAPKQAIEQQYAEERAAGQQNPAPKSPGATYPIVPQQPFETGILDDCSPPFSSDVVTITSCWQGIENGGEIQVYAGAQAENPDQGVIIALSAQGTGKSVVTPVQAGAVQIVAAEDGVLTLVSAQGSYVMTFNVATGAFSSAVVEPGALISTNQVTVTTSGLAYSRTTQTYTGTITVKNLGVTTINGPIQIIFSSLTPGVTLANETGVFNGSPYLSVPTATNLPSNQSATSSIVFDNPSNSAIHFTPTIYSGSLQ